MPGRRAGGRPDRSGLVLPGRGGKDSAVVPGFLVQDYLELVGQKLGPYEVREIASMGGVALVYRGQHETLHNQVAIKVLTPEAVSEGARETLEQLFLREAQILSQLRSEDILRAYDVGRARCPSDGVERPYMVVDWLEGHTFNAELERRREENRPFTLPEVLELLEPIARGLDVAHANGIIHRDVNPRNFLIEQREDGSPHAKLIDFGFAKAIESSLTVQAVTGTLYAGSPDYSAPEHYDRERYGELSELTDLYTLALSLVEALTLQPPLEGTTPEALAYCTANPDVRPTPRTRGADVSDEVEALFEKALAVDQFDRPPSVLRWWNDLRTAAGLDVPEPESTPAPPAPRPWPRRIGFALVGLVFVGGASAGVARFVPWPLSCPAGRADCNRRALDGCETDLGTSALDCGACGHPCPTGKLESTCRGGQCRVLACLTPGRLDCDGNADNGCEVDVDSDPDNCGDCGKVCSRAGTAKVVCAHGTCNVACKAHFGDCNKKPDDGCETDLDKDPQHCGRCDRVCTGTRCGDGLCEPKVLTTVQAAEHVAAAGGGLYFWDDREHQIRGVAASGNSRVVAEHVSGLVDLAVGRDVVVWSTDRPAQVWAARISGGAPVAIATLPKPSDLVVDGSGNFVAWAARAKGVGSKPDGVTVAPLDATLLDKHPAPVDCHGPVSAFAGDGDGVVCCAAGSVIVGYSCSGGSCKPHRYRMVCPKSLAIDPDWIYYPAGVRVLGIDRKSGKLHQFAKRGSATRDLAFDGGYLYFLAGDRDADVLRVQRLQVGAASLPELLARHQLDASSLTTDAHGVYWTTRAAGGLAIDMLPK